MCFGPWDEPDDDDTYDDDDDDGDLWDGDPDYDGERDDWEKIWYGLP